jgi:hypothetical protein
MKARNARKKNNNRKKGRRNGGYRLRGGGYTAYDRPSITFIDPHRYCTLKYSQLSSHTMLTVAGSQSTFRLNSIFDPDAAVGGHQPYGYDQLAALYNRYRVLKTRWKVTFGNQAGGFDTLVLPINGALAASVADAATFQTASENPYAKPKVQGGGGAPTVIHTGMMALNKLGGVKLSEYLDDDRFEAQIGANPAEVINLLVCTYNPTASTITATFVVELWYEVDLHDPISQAGS